MKYIVQKTPDITFWKKVENMILPEKNEYNRLPIGKKNYANTNINEKISRLLRIQTQSVNFRRQKVMQNKYERFRTTFQVQFLQKQNKSFREREISEYTRTLNLVSQLTISVSSFTNPSHKIRWPSSADIRNFSNGYEHSIFGSRPTDPVADSSNTKPFS